MQLAQKWLSLFYTSMNRIVVRFNLICGFKLFSTNSMMNVFLADDFKKVSDLGWIELYRSPQQLNTLILNSIGHV